MKRLEKDVRALVLLALTEDRAFFDITSQSCIPPDHVLRACLLLKETAKVAGLPLIPWVCDSMSPDLEHQILVEEGGIYPSGTVLAILEGKAQLILSLERTLLNLIQHTSGVAQGTYNYVKAIKGFSCDILDTRKTLPGLRSIQKYGVIIGGGKNHRFDLQERFLVKDNHLFCVKKGTSSPITEAIFRIRAQQPDALIEVEVENLTMFEEALKGKVSSILLDNMSPYDIHQAVEMGKGYETYLEASGGIDLSNVREYAATGVHGISIGALTHSVKAVDISLDPNKISCRL